MAKTERGPPKLVAAVGSDKFGAVAVLRNSLVPELVTEVPLPGGADSSTFLSPSQIYNNNQLACMQHS